MLVAYLLALTKANGLAISRVDLSRLVQRAENEYVGVASGRLDQSMILLGRAGCLTKGNTMRDKVIMGIDNIIRGKCPAGNH